MNRLLKATGFTHLLLRNLLCLGQKVIDATAGNGHDTLFLAQIVGTTGLVYAFDIQAQALKETKQLLTKNNCLEQVKLIHDGHENIKNYVQESVQAIIYNLGYLPGGNKEIVTKGETTLFSLQQGMDLLSSGGIIILSAYPGHTEGEKEAKLIEEYVASLSTRFWQIMKWDKVNGDRCSAPSVFCIYKS